MPLLLPALTFVLLYGAIYGASGERRQSFLHAAVICGVFVVFSTELLSLFHALTPAGLSTAWVVACLCAATTLIAGRRKRPQGGLPPGRLRSEPASPDAAELWMPAGIGLIVVAVGAVAVIAPPNTWDVAEYHLPRAFFWLQNHSVAYYPSPDFAQNILAPFAEFAIAQTYALSGSDRFANCIEFFAFIGSTIAVSSIAQRLGCGRRGQILAALICATIPGGILEASGSMNTFVLAFWISSAVYFLLLSNEEPTALNLFSLGASVGLAMLTKGLAYILLPPLLLAAWFIGWPKSRRLLLPAPLLIVLALALNAGFFARNYAFSGNPLGAPLAEAGPRMDWGVAHVSVEGAVANTLRNLSLHLGLPSHFSSFRDRIESSFRIGFQRLGMDADDPGQTWAGGGGFRWPSLGRHEIWAGNHLHPLLFLAALFLLAFHLRQRNDRNAFLLSLGLIGGFILFSASIRYSIWSSRYHLPLFVVAAPIIAFVVSEHLSARAGVVIAVVLFLWALPFALGNSIRSLAPGDEASIFTRSRAELYLADQHFDEAQDYISAVDSLAGSSCRDIAILPHVSEPAEKQAASPKSLYIYPLLALLDRQEPSRRFEYVGVTNSTARLTLPDRFDPCVVICLDCVKATDIPPPYDRWASRDFGFISVLEPPKE